MPSLTALSECVIGRSLGRVHFLGAFYTQRFEISVCWLRPPCRGAFLKMLAQPLWNNAPG
jgi:hypothetical protein